MENSYAPSNFRFEIKPYCKNCNYFEVYCSCLRLSYAGEHENIYTISCKHKNDCQKKIEYLRKQLSKEALC